jgi:hypothetical protein
MARAPKRQPPKYVSFEHDGVSYVIDLVNREVLRNWVAIERQAMPDILAACTRHAGEPVAV